MAPVKFQAQLEDLTPRLPGQHCSSTGECMASIFLSHQGCPWLPWEVSILHHSPLEQSGV